jgi:hypothetical protein
MRPPPVDPRGANVLPWARVNILLCKFTVQTHISHHFWHHAHFMQDVLVEAQLAVKRARQSCTAKGIGDAHNTMKALQERFRVCCEAEAEAGVPGVAAAVRSARRQMRLLAEELETLRTRTPGSAGAGAGGSQGAFTRSSNDILLDKARREAAATSGQLRQARAELDSTLDIGRSALVDLDEQAVVLGRVNVHVDVVATETALARQHLTRFAKRMATDKVLVLGVCLCMCMIVAVVTYRFVGK